MTTNSIRLYDLFKYFKNLPHQSAAITELEESINKANPHILGRDQEWFKTWSQAGKQPEPNWLEPALKIIKEFEGCRLVAYQDVAGIWTVGWGTIEINGRPVKQGDKLTQQEADAFLLSEVEAKARGLFKLLPMAEGWGGDRAAALISWAYNVGLGAVETSTLRKRLLGGEDPVLAVSEELPRWNKADGKEILGLTRRRNAEVALFVGKELQQPNQKPAPEFGNPLSVQWYAQLDSATDQARRMCFSSSCAMMLSFLKPGVLQGANGDDQYLKRVQQYGDTTDPKAQIHALSSYGVNARFVKNANFELIEKQINKGVPVPCGYLHRGPVSAPSGGGHYLCIVGIDATHIIVHDPLGESDLINGTTLATVARYAYYSKKNWGPRWMVEGPNTGWAIIAER